MKLFEVNKSFPMKIFEKLGSSRKMPKNFHHYRVPNRTWGVTQKNNGLQVRPISIFGRFAGLVIFAGCWEIISFLTKTPFMPRFGIILTTLFDLLLHDNTWIHIQISVERVIVGLIIASLIGILLGITMTQFMLIMFSILPIVDLMRSIAGLAIYPLVILFLGLGSSSKIFLVFWGAWPAIVLNTIHAFLQTDQTLVEASQIDGANRFQALAYISFPLAIPTIVTGIRIGAGVGWISLVASEMLGGNKGLGYFILAESQVFHFSRLYAGIILVSILGLVTHTLLSAIQSILERGLYT